MMTIEIDFDVYKAIETERRGFDEPRNAALRRLLGLPPAPEVALAPVPRSLESWEDDGVTLPGGTKLRMAYSGRAHEGIIDKGTWLVEGRRFKSPSGAASAVARTKKGKTTKLDGWI